MSEIAVLHGSFTSSSIYKPMLFLALASACRSRFRTVNLKNGVQKEPAYLAINRYGQVPVLRHRGLTIVQSNVILDYLARTTGISRADRSGSLAGPRMAVVGERRHHQRGAGVRHFARFRLDGSTRGSMDFFRPRPRRRSTSRQSLAGRDWRGRAYSIADIGCWGRMVSRRGWLVDRLPFRNLAAEDHEYLQAMRTFAHHTTVPEEGVKFAEWVCCGAYGSGGFYSVNIDAANGTILAPERWFHLDEVAAACWYQFVDGNKGGEPFRRLYPLREAIDRFGENLRRPSIWSFSQRGVELQFSALMGYASGPYTCRLDYSDLTKSAVAGFQLPPKNGLSRVPSGRG